jgi:hypothetical protein
MKYRIECKEDINDKKPIFYVYDGDEQINGGFNSKALADDYIKILLEQDLSIQQFLAKELSSNKSTSDVLDSEVKITDVDSGTIPSIKNVTNSSRLKRK